MQTFTCDRCASPIEPPGDGYDWGRPEPPPLTIRAIRADGRRDPDRHLCRSCMDAFRAWMDGKFTLPTGPRRPDLPPPGWTGPPPLSPADLRELARRLDLDPATFRAAPRN